jgi:hypothetical protein
VSDTDAILEFPIHRSGDNANEVGRWSSSEKLLGGSGHVVLDFGRLRPTACVVEEEMSARVRTAIMVGVLASVVSSTLAQGCDPNYAGACVPNVDPADVDCLDGEGNGPYFTDGTTSFEVVGEDVYGLDTNDPDNLACEPRPARD